MDILKTAYKTLEKKNHLLSMKRNTTSKQLPSCAQHIADHNINSNLHENDAKEIQNSLGVTRKSGPLTNSKYDYAVLLCKVIQKTDSTFNKLQCIHCTYNVNELRKAIQVSFCLTLIHRK